MFWLTLLLKYHPQWDKYLMTVWITSTEYHRCLCSVSWGKYRYPLMETEDETKWSDCVEPVSSSHDWSSNFTGLCHLFSASFDSKKLDNINRSDLDHWWRSPRSPVVFFSLNLTDMISNKYVREWVTGDADPSELSGWNHTAFDVCKVFDEVNLWSTTYHKNNSRNLWIIIV